MVFYLVTVLESLENESPVLSESADARERGDQSQRQKAVRIHFSAQEEVLLQILVREVVFTEKERH